MDAALELAAMLARGPARVLAAAKASLNRGLASDLWAELDATVTAQIGCFATRDFAEGGPDARRAVAGALQRGVSAGSV